MHNYKHPLRESLHGYHLRYELTDGDGRLFGLKARLRHILRQRPAQQEREGGAL